LNDIDNDNYNETTQIISSRNNDSAINYTNYQQDKDNLNLIEIAKNQDGSLEVSSSYSSLRIDEKIEINSQVNTDLNQLDSNKTSSKIDAKLYLAGEQLTSLFESNKILYFQVNCLSGLKVSLEIEHSTQEVKILPYLTLIQVSEMAISSQGIPRVKLSDGSGWISYVYDGSYDFCIEQILEEEYEKRIYKGVNIDDPIAFNNLIRAFYEKYNPTKLGDVVYIISKYKGKEKELLLKLEKQYEATVPIQKLGSSDLSAEFLLYQKVTEFYVKYNPSKIQDVEYLISKYKGREDELLANLEAKYIKGTSSAKGNSTK
jgi:hypothetical protein